MSEREKKSEPTRLKAVATGVFWSTPIAALGIFAGSIIVGMSPEIFIEQPVTSLDDDIVRTIPTSYVVAGGSLLIGSLASLTFKSGRTFPLTSVVTMLICIAAITVTGGFESFQFASELDKFTP